MKITIITVGKLKEAYLKEGVAEYLKRLTKYTKLEIIELPDEKTPQNASINLQNQIKQIEGKRIIEKTKDSYIISLAIEGKELTSEQLADKLNEITTYRNSNITFIIGGSLGLSDEVKKKSDLLLSFSKFTFPHQLMKLILLEQVYRSFRIKNNEPYHK